MSPKLKTSGVFLALMLGSVLAVHQAGCLTPGQQADMAAYSQQLDKDQALVLDLQGELAKYSEQLKKVVADVKADVIPAASDLELGQKIMANMDASRAKLAQVLAQVEATKTAVKKLQDGGAPWWAYAIPTGLTVAQLLGTFVPQLSFLVPIAGALKGQLAGAQTQLAATQQTLDVRTEIAGSLSRTVDALAPKARAPGEAYAKEGVGPVDPPLAQLKEKLLLREMSLDEVATKADYDEIRRIAQAQQI